MKIIEYNIKEHVKYGTQWMFCLDNFNENNKYVLLIVNIFFIINIFMII